MAARISPDHVGVFLCRARGKSGPAEAAEEIARFLQDRYPAVRIRLASLPLEDPGALPAFVHTHALCGLVIFLGEDPASQPLLQESAEDSGLPPWAVHLVPSDGVSPAPESKTKAIERAKALCGAAVERALTFEDVPLEHLKSSYPALDSCLSRRALFRSLARVRYQVVPRVNAPRCKHRQGCNLCMQACPLGAIAPQADNAAIDKVACDGCGICVKACPAGAIHYPPFAPYQIDQAMRGLLHPEVLLAPRIIALTCKDVAVPPVSGVLPLSLPCVGMASPFILLRAFDLGADGVALIQRGRQCGRRHEFARLAQDVRTSHAALEAFGIEKERILLVPAADCPEAILLALVAFSQRVQELGPPRSAALQPVQPNDHEWQLGPLLAGIARKISPMKRTSRELPLGLLQVEAARCTLCGLCAIPCPTEALRFTGDAGQAALTFNHATCVACAFCLRACPEKALTLRRELDFRRLANTATLIREEMAHCRRCGVAFAPLKMCQKIRDRLAKSGTPRPEYVMSSCPDCRVVDIASPRPSAGPGETCLAGVRQSSRER